MRGFIGFPAAMVAPGPVSLGWGVFYYQLISAQRTFISFHCHYAFWFSIRLVFLAGIIFAYFGTVLETPQIPAAMVFLVPIAAAGAFFLRIPDFFILPAHAFSPSSSFNLSHTICANRSAVSLLNLL